MGHELKVIENPKMVCPFRTLTKLVPNQFNAADQVVEYPECQYALCPYFNNELTNNSTRCRRVTSQEHDCYL